MKRLSAVSPVRAVGIILVATLMGVGLGLSYDPAKSDIDRPEIVESIRIALDDSDPISRIAVLGRALAELDERDVPAVLQAFEDARHNTGRAELTLLAHAWGRLDAPAAFDTFVNWTQGKRNHALPALLRRWAMRDPETAVAALDRVAALNNDSLFEASRIAVLLGWLDSGKPGAVEFAALHVPARREVTRSLIEWAGDRDGAEAVQDWLRATLDSENERYRRVAFEEATRYLADRDAAATAAYVEPHLDHSYGRGGMQILARTWAMQSPEAAIDWLNRRPSDQARSRAISSVLGFWLRVDEDSAWRWITGVPRSRALDDAIFAHAKLIQAAAGGRAETWCERLSAAALRARCLVTDQSPAQ